jgi:hypothetical protein
MGEMRKKARVVFFIRSAGTHPGRNTARERGFRTELEFSGHLESDHGDRG